MSFRVLLDGRQRNLLLYNEGPYTYDDDVRCVRKSDGEAIYQLEVGEQGGAEIVERWNKYYALYLMLK